MALQTKLEAPDASATINFKDAAVTMDVIRDVIAVPTAANLVVGVDIRKARRVFTIQGMVTVEGASSAKTLVEQMETAAITWPTLGDGRSRFVWGKKQDGTDKDYDVFITRLHIVNSPSTHGGAGTIYDFTMQLTEVGTLSTSG